MNGTGKIGCFTILELLLMYLFTAASRISLLGKHNWDVAAAVVFDVMRFDVLGVNVVGIDVVGFDVIGFDVVGFDAFKCGCRGLGHVEGLNVVGANVIGVLVLWVLMFALRSWMRCLKNPSFIN